ncbi:MAG: hemolysin family protein [Pelagimonas sp.]|jgi:magnesium and cobalt transporter|nr:hemolysin family protein [Pelagimonas sp.]
MGEIDGSSNAAQSAQETRQVLKQANGTAAKPGLFGRIGSWFNGDAVPPPQASLANGAVPQRQMHGMINLRRMRVEDVAVPRAEIVAVSETVSKDELLQTFRESGLTRLPVYDGTLDTPIGMAHLKDFALSHGFNGTQEDFDLQSMLRPLLFVPPSMPIGVLLTKMQTERRHMALVIDEYGGVDGIVTIEDLIEQVIGEIEDEHDGEEDQLWLREGPGCYLAVAKTPLDEFETEIGVTLSDHDDVDTEEVDTLGGLVFVLAGHVPTRGEVVPHPKGVEFEVVDADPRRIKRLRVRLPGADRASQPASASQIDGTHG